MAIIDWIESSIDSRIKYTGNHKEVHFNCPVCSESKLRCFVNLENGKVYCHNCGWSTNIVGLIQYIEGISWSRANLIFKDIKGNFSLPERISKEQFELMFLGDIRGDLNKRPIPLPEEYILLNPDSVNLVMKRAVKYLNKRGISNYQIRKHKFGFCMSGIYKNRVIIPITEGNDLKFWIARAISPSEYLKEKSPSNEDYQISKSEVIFNVEHAARKYHSIVISEGIFDALSWGDIGVSLLGKTLYQEQLNILLDYRELLTGEVFIALDYDAYDKATEMAEVLSEYFSVSIVNIPEEYDDPNNVLLKKGKKYMAKLLEEAESYSEFSSIHRLLT